MQFTPIREIKGPLSIYDKPRKVRTMREVEVFVKALANITRETHSSAFRWLIEGNQCFGREVIIHLMYYRPRNIDRLRNLRRAIDGDDFKVGDWGPYMPIRYSPDNIMVVLANDDLHGFIPIIEDLRHPWGPSTIPFEMPDLYPTSDRGFSYAQLAAFLGATRCFKYLVATEDYAPRDAPCLSFAIAGGELEIIKECIKHEPDSPGKYYSFAVTYHRYEVAKWIRNNYAETIHDPFTFEDLIETHNITEFMIKFERYTTRLDTLNLEELFKSTIRAKNLPIFRELAWQIPISLAKGHELLRYARLLHSSDIANLLFDALEQH